MIEKHDYAIIQGATFEIHAFSSFDAAEPPINHISVAPIPIPGIEVQESKYPSYPPVRATSTPQQGIPGKEAEVNH